MDNLTIIRKGFLEISKEIEENTLRIKEKQRKIKDEIKRAGRRNNGFIV